MPDKNEMAKVLVSARINKLIYKPWKSGKKATCFCPKCRKTFVLTKSELETVKKVHACPNCMSDLSATSKITKHELSDFIFDGSKEDWSTYHVSCKLNFNKLTFVKCEKVAYGNGKDIYKRHCHVSFMGYCLVYDLSQKDWKKTRSSSYCHGWIKDYFLKEPTKKTSLETIVKEEYNGQIKSNQRYIAINNIMNQQMLRAMITFNINDYDTLLSNAKRFGEFRFYSGNEDLEPMSIHDFEYLYLQRGAEGSIYSYGYPYSLSDYNDYLKECRLMGIKNRHPKNFVEEHQKLNELASKLVEEEKKKKYEVQIPVLAHSLPDKQFDNGIIIEPLSSYEDVWNTAHKLHNCIFSCYLDKYANNETHLYKVIVKNKLYGAVEICDGKLIQARANCNANMSKTVYKTVQQFAQLASV